MHKLILLSGAFLCACLSHAQQTDTLLIFYKTDQYSISKQDKQKLDSFLRRGWDKLSINGYTDEMDDETYNLGLSQKRSGEVFKYCMTKNIPENAVSSQYFGESAPRADNESEEGRAMNRRTEIVGYRYPRVKPKPYDPSTDPMTPQTRTLDNGFIITYRPGMLPGYMADNFASGSGENFQLITNTVEMRQNNLYNNTTRGEILSSVLIVCGQKLNPCKLDSPILVKVPLPFKTKCPVETIKFFNAVAERGKQIWQEESKTLYPETINGVQYLRLWLDDFCQCINFDIKIPDCYETDSTKLMWVNANMRGLTAEIQGLNSVYMPRKIDDSTHSIMYVKDKLDETPVSFSLYNGKRRIRGFKDKIISHYPYDSLNGKYILSTGTQQFYFSKLNIWGVVLTVNGDRYRVIGDGNKYDFVYLKEKKDSILLDFTVEESRKRVTVYRNQPLASIPYDATKGCYVIDKTFIRQLKEKRKSNAVASN